MATNKIYDYLIVGAGPAGIFCALEIVDNEPGKKIAVVDMGARVEERNRSNAMCGFGGAGTYSDGKLHYTPKLSHERMFHLVTPEDYQILLDQVEATFKKFGVNSPFYPGDDAIVHKLVDEAEKQEVELVVRKAQHAGTDKLREVILRQQEFLEKQGVELMMNTQITDIIDKEGTCTGVVDSQGREYTAKKILMAPGRISAKWLQEIAKKHGMKYQYDMVEVGVRVEFPHSIMERYTDALYEVVMKVRTPTFDDIMRTFCSCPNGMVAVENYQGYVCVNGHSNSDHQSVNSNFAFVCEVHLTEPVENSIAYGESIAKLASTIGGGKPVLQRLADLKKGRRSNWSRISNSVVRPSLKDVTPGDISMALPHRLVVDILEGLEILDRVMPGINSGSTLLYAPEVKFRSSKVLTNAGMETNIKNLHAAGDAGGFSGSITGAAVTGILAARGMMGKPPGLLQ